MPTRIGYIVAIVTIISFAIQGLIWAYGVYQWFQPAPVQLSAADLLVIDQNPTKVEITNVSVDPFKSRDEKYVFLTLTNNSSVTAKNVQLDIYNYLGTKVPLDDTFANGYEGTGTDIPAGESKRYRIAPVAEYATLFSVGNTKAKLLRVSTQLQDEKPGELAEIVCGDLNTGPCTFDTIGLSTVLQVRYGSIFGEKHEFLTQFYNTFLIDSYVQPR